MRKIKLNKFKNKKSQNADVYTPAFLDSTYKEIQNTNISYNIDNNDIYLNEKDNSNVYRIMINVKPVLTNILPSLSLIDGIGIFNNDEFKNVLDPINSGLDVKNTIQFKDSYYKNLVKNNGWLGFHKVIGLNRSNNFTELAPRKYDLDLFDDDDYENWNFSLYYIYKRSNVMTTKGLPISTLTSVDYGGNRKLECLLSTIDHNLEIGDRVYIGNLSSNNGEYKVLDIGNSNNEFKNNYFVVDLPDGVNLTPETYFKRVVNGIPSEYYYRHLRKAPTVSGRILNKNSYKLLEAGFSQTIFEDKIGNVLFHEDINLENVLDYMNRPVLSLILCTFKERKTKTGVNYFTTLNSALNLNETRYYNTQTPDIRKVNVNTYNYFTQTNLNVNSNDIIYDVVEYNIYEMEEYSLNKTNFRFNLIDREANVSKPLIDNGKTIDLGVRNEGYFYDPFLEIKIQELSDYIESGDEFDEIPYYAEEISQGNFIWRDVISKSKNSNINYPFINGVHNIVSYYNLLQKRQDPFNIHGLRYTSFPADIPGEENTLLTDEVIENNLNDEC